MKRHIAFFSIGALVPVLMGLSLLITLPMYVWLAKHSLLFPFLGFMMIVMVITLIAMWRNPTFLVRFVPKPLRIVDNKLMNSFTKGLAMTILFLIGYLIENGGLSILFR